MRKNRCPRHYSFSFRVLILAVLCFSFFTVNAQYENLLNKTYAQRAPQLWKIGDSVYYQPDSTEAFRVAGSLIEFGKKHKDASLQLEAELYGINYIKHHFSSQQYERILSTLNDIIKRAAAAKAWNVELKARTVLADFYWSHEQNYELALEEYNRLDRLLKPVSLKEYPEKIQVLYYIGSAYFSFNDYRKAIRYFYQVPEMEPEAAFQKMAYVQSVNNMAIAYQELNELDSSDYYFNLLYQYAVNQNDSSWIGIVKGNLGHNEFLRGNFEQAVPLMKACIERATIDNDPGLASGSLMPLADIYFRQNKPAKAIAAVMQARDMVSRSGQYRRYRYLYPLLAKMYSYKGNPFLAQQYMDSTTFVADSLNRKFSGLMVARALQKDAIAEQKAKLADIESRKKLLTLKFYAFLALAIIVFAITIYIYRNKRLRHKQEQALKDLQLREKEKELLMAQTQLHDFAHHIAEKNQLIQLLEEQHGNNKVLEELEQSVILTGKDWGRFRELFEKVHPGYLQRLTEKISGITPSEVRLMALAKLNFSNKEMAAALGVSSQAIRVTWHRLRKKNGLPEDGTIEELSSHI